MNTGLERLSTAILRLDFAAKGVFLIISAFFSIVFVVFFLHSYYKNSLLARSAGKKKSFPVVFISVYESFGKIAGNFLILLPVLGGIIIAAGVALGISKTVSTINAFIEREKQIKALTIAVNYLNQSDKTLDIWVRSADADGATIKIDYKAVNPSDTSVPPIAWTKTLSIAGTELHFDCVVFNFSFSEIGAGRQRNIAVPYRVFSNKIAAIDGIKLFGEDESLPEEDDYGFIPQIYREQLKKLLTDADFAHEMGVRSVNGSDVWRANVKIGDHFRIKVEQTGGLTMEKLIF
jgi:hypothetical protein